jgi:acetyl esterase/lipase
MLMKNFVLWTAIVSAMASSSLMAQTAPVNQTGNQTVNQPMNQPEPILLWPHGAPDLKEGIGAELDTTPPDPNKPDAKYVMRLGNVTKPTITVFKPAPEKDTGAAIVVCPGGGYNILAYNLEGTEVCAWLNSIGVTGVLLKYRVPGRLTEEYKAPLQDAQRALGLVRFHAKEWNLDTKRIGILGFSAGGHLSAALSTNYQTRTYTAIDDADKENCRPDFTVLVYPAYLTNKELNALAPEIKVDAQTPPAFLVQTEDDGIHVENVIVYAGALRAANVPVELHVYPKGGHGYGLRSSPNAVSHWPDRVADWLKSQGWLHAK